MPSATRNTNTNNGNDASAPANPNTYLNSSELMPRAAPKDSTTVATRISGAVTARSRTIRTSSTTSSTIGMITRLSRLDAFSTSSRNAVAPPTSASEPGSACTALRAGAGHGVHRAPPLLHRRERGRLGRVTVERCRDERDAVLDRRLAGLAAARDPGQGLRHVGGLVAVGDDHEGGGLV